MLENSQKSKQTTLIAGMAGALLASTCCILPLVLVSLGVSGVWIGSLTALEPYKYLIALVTGGFLAVGFYLVYRKRSDCEDQCRTRTQDRLIKMALWVATALIVISLTVEFWAPVFY